MTDERRVNREMIRLMQHEYPHIPGQVIFNDRHRGHGTFEVRIDRRRVHDTGELFVVAGPDPPILVADEMLWTMVHHREDIHPAITLAWQPLESCPPPTCCQVINGRECFYGALLTFDTTSGRIV